MLRFDIVDVVEVVIYTDTVQYSPPTRIACLAIKVISVLCVTSGALAAFAAGVYTFL